MLARFPLVCDALVFQWLSLRELLETRGCSRALRDRYAPRHPIWKTLCPNPARLKLQLCANVPSAVLIRSAYTITRETVLTWKALRCACARGRLEVAQWLSDHFELTAEDARACNNAALRYACDGGYLEVAQWLTDRFRLTSEDARAGDNAALCMASTSGHLPVASWLADRFGLTTDDARAHGNFALYMATERGHCGVVKWLIARFRLTIVDIDDARRCTFPCGCGHC
jgi:hypothetical protein